MIGFDEALARVLERAWAAGAESIPVRAATGRRLARPVDASHDSPSFGNAAMDGYALGSVEGPWRIVGEVPAGSVGVPLAPGQAARIFTGAPVPPGAVAVLAQEDARVDGVVLTSPIAPCAGAHVRVQGEEFCAGTRLIEVGALVTPPVAALLASQGMTHAHVRRRPKIAILATGAELIEPGEILPEAKVYESNTFALVALLAPIAEEVATARVGDDRQEVERALGTFAGAYDAVLTVGGVSVGGYDFVPAAAAALGFENVFSGVAMRPGKPVTFGTRDGCAWFGLPGNPMSAITTAALFALPWMGERDSWRSGRLAAPASHRAGRESFVPAVDVAGAVTVAPVVGSHSTAGLVGGTGWVRLAGSDKEYAEGGEVPYMPFPWSTA